jgi:acyl carrier protein
MENNQLRQEVCSLAAEIFLAPVEQVPESLAYGDLPQWDSLGHMDLMMALESRYGVQISTETIARLVSLPEIVTYLSETSLAGKEDQHA